MLNTGRIGGLRWGMAGAIGLIALILTGAVACISETPDSDSSQGIWVTGAGSMAATPDLAVLSLGVEFEADTVSDALAGGARSMQAVIDSLLAAGVPEEDIQTRHFSVSTRSEWNDLLRRSEMTGFAVSNIVTVEVRDLDSIGGVIDSAVTAGGDAARIHNLSFQVEDPANAEREARVLAMSAALEQASQLAEAAGLELGEPFSIVESGAAPIFNESAELMRSTAASVDFAATPIQVGEQDVIIYVRVGYGIN